MTEDLWNVDTTRVQWEFIIGLLNEAVYAGRIECIEDLSILEAYLNMYFTDEVLSHKWRLHGINVALPNGSQITVSEFLEQIFGQRFKTSWLILLFFKEYLQVVKQFPNKDQPIVFGLPENVDKAREKQMSLKLIQGLKGNEIV